MIGNQLLGMFESLAALGTAPPEGCSLFGVGYDTAFAQLRQKFLIEWFDRGISAEKFVIGPFGAGKTHFLRQLMEIAREHDCVTAEVSLNKNIDFTSGLVVYEEIACQLRAPGDEAKGLRSVLLHAMQRVHDRAASAGMPGDEILEAWGAGLEATTFESPAFGRVLRRAVEAHRTGDTDAFEAAVRWLSGEVTDKGLSRSVGEGVLSAQQLKVHAHKAKLSLFQFVRHAGYRGTVVGFDEAEQSMAVDKKKMAKIFSHLLGEINAIAALHRGSALVVYAVTPDVMEKIQLEMPMLMQRLADPGPGQGFFDGNALAAKIDLTQRGDAVDDLARIGERLTTLFFRQVPEADRTREAEALSVVRTIATVVAAEEASSSARRVMVKRVCAGLVNDYMAAPRLSPIVEHQPREAEV